MDLPREHGDVDLIFDDGSDPVDAAFVMLAFVLGELPPAKREARLQELEDGKLRAAVGRYVISRVSSRRESRSPYPAH